MRLLILLQLLLAIPAFGAERTWTIAREVYTAEAELVAVRGNVAYLKMSGRVEEVPLERLSAIDQQYIASLSLAPVMPGPANEFPGPAEDKQVLQEEMPLPVEPDGENKLELNAPDLAPAFGGTPLSLQPQPRAFYRADPSGRVLPPQPGVATNYLAPSNEPRTSATPNDRRYLRPPQQGPNNQAAATERNDDHEDRPGLFGARARRLERQRAAAARSR